MQLRLCESLHFLHFQFYPESDPADKILVKQNTLADVLDVDVFVCVMDGGELGFVQIDGGKAEDGIGDVGETAGIGSGCEQERSHDDIREIFVQNRL